MVEYDSLRELQQLRPELAKQYTEYATGGTMSVEEFMDELSGMDVKFFVEEGVCEATGGEELIGQSRDGEICFYTYISDDSGNGRVVMMKNHPD